MSIICKVNEVENLEYRFKEFDSNGNLILSEISNDFNEIEIKNPLKIIQNVGVFPCKNFIFYNKNFSESNIYQVFEKEKKFRMGWIFPLQALISQEHDYADDVHFLNYAYMTLFNLFADDSVSNKSLKPIYREDGIYELGDFYDVENIQILVLSLQSINRIPGFEIDDYYLDFYSKGYFLKEYSGERRVVQADQTIKVSKISPDMKNDHYPIHLFTDIIIMETHQLVKFHLLYQVVELIIDKIFNKELKSILQDLDGGQKKLSQIKEDFSDLSKENTRIKKLFTEYTGENSLKLALKEECNKLLLNNDRDQKSHSGLALYAVRNLIVHDYRSISSGDYDLVREINYLFEDVIIDILINIKDLN